MVEEKNKNNLKIVFLGFDWNNIGLHNVPLTLQKLDRDGLRTDINEFVLLYAGLKISRQKIRERPLLIIRHFYLLSKIRIFYDLFFIFYLPFVLWQEKFKPDVFYLCDWPHVLASIIPSKICRSKIYFRLVNLPTRLALAKGRKGKLFYWYYYLAEKLTVKFIDRFVVINETTKKYLIDLGVKSAKIIFDIPDTIWRDREYIKKADNKYIRRLYNISDDKKIILSIGSLIPEKGHADLIKAIARLKRDDLMLIICGQGKEAANLQRLSKELGLEKRIIFAGQVGRKNIWHYFAGADIFMLFSQSESLGMVFWEAMYIDLPVIGTPVGGVRETIGTNGLRGFYWQDDIDKLNQNIDFCINKNSLARQEMVEKARNYVAGKLQLQKTINQIYDTSTNYKSGTNISPLKR